MEKVKVKVITEYFEGSIIPYGEQIPRCHKGDIIEVEKITWEEMQKEFPDWFKLFTPFSSSESKKAETKKNENNPTYLCTLNFKGIQCGYIGNVQKCDKTEDYCKSLFGENNFRNHFRGFNVPEFPKNKTILDDKKEKGEDNTKNLNEAPKTPIKAQNEPIKSPTLPAKSKRNR